MKRNRRMSGVANRLAGFDFGTSDDWTWNDIGSKIASDFGTAVEGNLQSGYQYVIDQTTKKTVLVPTTKPIVDPVAAAKQRNTTLLLVAAGLGAFLLMKRR